MNNQESNEHNTLPIASFIPQNISKPNNQDAEIAVLGAMLFSPEAVTTAMSQLRTIPNAFFRPAHQALFNAMIELVGSKSENAIDDVILTDYLASSGKLSEVGGRDYIMQLMDSVPTASNIEYYVSIVKQNAILRLLIDKCAATISECYSGQHENVQQLLDGVEQEIFSVAGHNEAKAIQTVQELAKEAVAYLDKLIHNDADVMGISTGFDIDRMITGLKPGELIVIAARPSIGKTALALNIAANIALSKSNPHPVGFFSLEMPALQLILRILCSEAKISLGDFKSGQITNARWTEVIEVAEDLKHSTIVIDDTGGIDILELKAKARRMQSRYGVQVIFIDYLQLIHAQTKSNASRENEVAMISGHLKALAKELGMPIVVLAQLNRQAEQGEKPKLSHLRESGAIEQDADVVAILHREREKQLAQIDDSTCLPAELIIAKNRNGATGVSELEFFPRFTRFVSKAKIDDKDLPQDV